MATVALGLTELIEDDIWYFVVCLIVRFLQGLGDIQVQTSCYSVLTSMFPENREKYLGMGEAAAGIGLMIGPVIGGILNTYLGYMECFFCFAGLLFVNIFVNIFILPKSLNNKMEDEEPDEEFRRSINSKKNVSYMLFLSNRRAMFAYFACAVVCIMTSFSSGFLTVVLTETMEIKEDYVGYILAIPAAAYILSSIFVNKFIDLVPRRIFIAGTFLIYFLATLLLGPSELLSFPKEVYIFMIGYFLSGVAQGFIFIPILPEVIDAVYTKTGVAEGEDVYFDGVVSDKAAGLYGSFYSLGLIIAPILGSEVYKALDGDWYLTCDCFAFFAATFCLIFFLCNVLPDIMKDKKERQENARKSQLIKEARQSINNAKKRVPAIKVEESDSLMNLASPKNQNNLSVTAHKSSVDDTSNLKGILKNKQAPSPLFRDQNNFRINILSENGQIQVR